VRVVNGSMLPALPGLTSWHISPLPNHSGLVNSKMGKVKWSRSVADGPVHQLMHISLGECLRFAWLFSAAETTAFPVLRQGLQEPTLQ